jgi:hypothetical protein
MGRRDGKLMRNPKDWQQGLKDGQERREVDEESQRLAAGTERWAREARI